MSEAGVLHLYKLTRFSNLVHNERCNRVFYTFTNLQGSQTDTYSFYVKKTFYTFTNLQGSQTNVLLDNSNERFYTFTNLQGSQTID